MRAVRFPALLALTALAACGGGGASSGTPTVAVASTVATGPTVAGRLVLAIPLPSTSSAVKRAPKFVSTGAVSAGVAINFGAATFFDVSATSSLCTTTAGVRTCTLSLGAPVGNAIAFSVSLYTQANGGGTLLGAGVNATTVVAGTPFNVTVGINPAVASVISSTPVSPNFTLGVAGSVTITPVFGDPSGAPITVSPATGLTTPGQTFTLTYDGSPAVGSVVATTVTSGGVTIMQNVIPTPGLLAARHGIGNPNSVDPEQTVVGPDGNLWWAEGVLNQVGHLKLGPGNNPTRSPTGFTLGTPHPYGIASGGDGHIWVSDGQCLIQRFDPTTATAFGAQIQPCGTGLPGQGSTTSLGEDSQGNVWFVDVGNSHVGYVDFNTLLVHTFGPTPSSPAFSNPRAGIALGPDNAIWFTEDRTNKIGRITTPASAVADGQPVGTTREFPVPTANASLTGIAKGGDGNMWFLEFNVNQFARITPTGVITEYPNVVNPAAFANMVVIAPDGSGNLWIPQGGGAVKVVPSNPTAAQTLFFTDNGQTDNHGVVFAPDGNMWFTGLGSAGGNGFIPTTDELASFTPR